VAPESIPGSEWCFDARSWPDHDLVAVGADLEPATIIAAYRAGAFPMPNDGMLCWFSPMDRAVFRPGGLLVTRSMRRSAKRFTVTLDTAFEAVIDACADPERPGAWINSEIRAAYLRLHDLGWAHSIETRDADGRLVGGLYGLAIGGLFAGESMFHTATDAGKVALMRLAEIDVWVDVQWQTPHLESLGVMTLPRDVYLALVPRLLARPLPPEFG
jgi:leucyl/phenylalanyl-tRNA--protein transferase